MKNEPQKPLGGHYKLPISANLLPHDLFLYLAIFVPHILRIDMEGIVSYTSIFMDWSVLDD
jgi:hypothetical protein